MPEKWNGPVWKTGGVPSPHARCESSLSSPIPCVNDSRRLLLQQVSVARSSVWVGACRARFQLAGDEKTTLARRKRRAFRLKSKRALYR